MTEPSLPEESIFAQALEITSSSERAAFLDRACGSNQILRAEVEALLHAHEQSGDLLDLPEKLPATLDQPAGERPGTIIGFYKLLEQIGEGGMGTVWMAEQTEPIRRRVAVKVVKEGMDSKQVLARFEVERQALALMEHPNIAKVLDAGKTPSGRPFFVMELVKGKPITTYCDEKRLAVRERLELFADVCRAVQHAHQKGIIHRDLKPSNVLVAPYDGKPVVKVIDFGVAKATGQQLTDKTLVTGFGALVGTPEYMSPEQAEINNQDIDTRSDIYSLGVLLYELLTGSTPLTRKRSREAALLEVLRVIREEEPPRPSTRLSESKDTLASISAQRQTEPAKLTKLLRGELDWIAMKALEKDRNRRYETANGLVMDVQRYLADEPVQACPPSAWYRLRKFVRRHKGPVLAVSIIVFLLAVGTVGTTIGFLRERAAERKAVKERDEKDEARRLTRQALNAMTDEVVEDLLGRQVQLTDRHRDFLKKVLAQHAAFAASKAEDREGQESRAAGYFRVALIHQRLGELKDAEAAYREALAICRQLAADFPNESSYRAQVAYHENNLGLVLRATGRHGEAEVLYREALSLRKALAEGSPSESTPRYLLATTYRNLGGVLEDTGRLPDAEVAFREALAICKSLAAEFPDDPYFREETGIGYQKVGIILANTGRSREAQAAFRDALAVSKQLAIDFPNRPDYRLNWAMGNHNLANLLRDTGQPKQAEIAFREAAAIEKQLVADFPNRPEFRHTLGTTSNNLANLLSDTGQREQAERVARDAVAVLKQLAADFPNQPQFRNMLATSQNSLGSLLLDLNRLKEAEMEFRGALASHKQLAAAFPRLPDYRRALALDQYNLAGVLYDSGQQKEAEAMLQEALALQTRLTADYANVPDYPNDLAGTLTKLAAMRYARREFSTAASLIAQARPHHQAALKASPKNDAYRQRYRNGFTLLLGSYIELADHVRLAAAAEELARFGYEPAEDIYTAASFLCRCVTLAGKDDKLAEAKRKELAQRYAERALVLLRQAVARGYKNAAQMKSDPELQPLRGQDEFRKLLADLERKEKK